MSARNYANDTLTNNRRPVDYKFSMTSLAGAAAAPTFLEGDGFNNLGAAANTATGTYLTLGRTGVGVYTIKTADAFPGFVSGIFQIAAATPAGELNISGPTAVHNSDNTWTLTISVFSGTSAYELATGDIIYGNLRFRNGTNVP